MVATYSCQCLTIICLQTIKLSHTIQKLPRQETSFVHAAAPRFLEEGARKAARENSGKTMLLIAAKLLRDVEVTLISNFGG